MSVAAREQLVEDAALARGLELVLVTNLVDVRWLTGFTGSNGLALAGRLDDGAVRLFVTDFRYISQVAEQLAPSWDRRQVNQELLGAALAEHLPAATDGRPPRIGFDDETLTVRQLERLREAIGERAELVPAGGLVSGLRERKDSDEVASIRAAAKLADAAFSQVIGRGLIGRTERAVALDLEITMRGLGAEAPSFPSIVASGAHGSLPHAVPREVEIPAGVLVTIDWGAKLDGYCSDCTRTLATGEVGETERAVYALVLEAQVAALEAVAPGPNGRELDAIARDIISAAGHGEHFGHGLGHGVGLEIHEGPRLSRTATEEPLEPGMIVTVEPGVYLPGVCGVRIEDLVCVTSGGHEVLNGLPKELQSVG